VACCSRWGNSVSTSTRCGGGGETHAMAALQRVSERQWEAVTMLPFTRLGDRPYNTYLNLA
jgi:hypothetical protein